LTCVLLIDTIGRCAADPHLEQPSALGSLRRRILARKITDCRPVKPVAAMSEQRQEASFKRLANGMGTRISSAAALFP
jgi:hypothetical protein